MIGLANTINSQYSYQFELYKRTNYVIWFEYTLCGLSDNINIRSIHWFCHLWYVPYLRLLQLRLACFENQLKMDERILSKIFSIVCMLFAFVATAMATVYQRYLQFNSRNNENSRRDNVQKADPKEQLTKVRTFFFHNHVVLMIIDTVDINIL